MAKFTPSLARSVAKSLVMPTASSIGTPVGRMRTRGDCCGETFMSLLSPSPEAVALLGSRDCVRAGERHCRPQGFVSNQKLRHSRRRDDRRNLAANTIDADRAHQVGDPLGS